MREKPTQATSWGTGFLFQNYPERLESQKTGVLLLVWFPGFLEVTSPSRASTLPGQINNYLYQNYISIDVKILMTHSFWGGLQIWSVIVVKMLGSKRGICLHLQSARNFQNRENTEPNRIQVTQWTPTTSAGRTQLYLMLFSRLLSLDASFTCYYSFISL